MFGLGVLAVAAGGCQQQDHSKHHHPRSEHVRNGDQDLLPGRVKFAFQREFPDATIEDVEKQVHPDGAVHWEVRYRTRDGQARTTEFNQDGDLIPRR